MRILVASLVIAVFGCKQNSPAGTVVTDWTYSPDTEGDTMPAALNPPLTVTQDVAWPIAGDAAVQLRFDTEIGENVSAGIRWHTPRHVQITLAQPTRVKLPKMNCMHAPPGNKIGPGGRLVPPVGRDGTTALGKVTCFSFAPEPDDYYFDIDGDGKVTSGLPSKGGSPR